jgi:hypothetical protein
MEKLDSAVIRQLREMAISGKSPSQMLMALRECLGRETHILTLVHYFQGAFSLDLSEAKPLVTFTRGGTGDVTDVDFLDKLVMPAIEAHKESWASTETP